MDAWESPQCNLVRRMEYWVRTPLLSEHWLMFELL